MKLSNRNGAAKRRPGGAFWARLRRSAVTMLALAALALSVCAPVAAAGESAGPLFRGGNDFATLTISESAIGVLSGKLVADVTITDKDGNEIPSQGGTLYVGEQYDIKLKFQEQGAGHEQFNYDGDGTLTYQLPKALKVEAQWSVPLKIEINGVVTEIGTYDITEDGQLIIHLSDTGKDDLSGIFSAELEFDMKATAQRVEGSGDDGAHFGDTGQDFWFAIADQPCVSVEKQGQYVENEDKTGGALEYTVKTKVDHGEVSDLVITDQLTPPNTTAFDVADVKPEDVTVQVKGGDGEIVDLTADVDYTLVQEADPEHPGRQIFKVVLNKESEYYPLQEGQELYVNYHYDVQYVEGSTDVFWGNVVNDVHVTGTGTVKADGQEPGTQDTTVEVDEHKGSNVEIQVVPPGEGIIFKTQEFSEKDHTLHYTLYTTVPAGNWTPFYIQDDMTVEFGGESYNLMEFKENGRVSNLKVSAVDVGNGELGNWSDSTGEQKRQSLEELKAQAHELKGYDIYNNWSNAPEGYDPENIENYISMWLNNNLEIVFGKYESGKTTWGNWNYQTDRLIITEYDLDMSDDGGPLALLDTSDYKTTLDKKASEVLQAGIWNNVHMRFDKYNPGYAVFFNNAERMNKTGVPDKNTDTITWTVTMNAVDTTVNKYFQDVRDDWMAYANDKYHWGNNKEAYEESMQAVFYDVLPDGWEYVGGSLTATARDIWGNESSYPYDSGQFYGFHDLVTQVGDKQVISAPLMFFNDTKNNDRPNLFNCIGSDLASLTFTYQLKATDQWLRAHATDATAVPVSNHAEIKDNKHDQAHWTADANVPYLPQYLTKEAKQDGKSNLLQFTLHVNRGAEKLDKEGKGYLKVTDTSHGITILEDTIEVLDGDTNEPLTFRENVSAADPVKSDEWGFLPADETGKFVLMVPDGRHLVITYDTLIPQVGTGVHVSNSASIDGVGRSNTDYEDSLVVEEIKSSGAGTKYTLQIKKVDDYDSTKTLKDAQFKFYFVTDNPEFKPDGAVVDLNGGTVPLIIGGKTYYGYSQDNWIVTTGEDGTCTVPSEWLLESGHYYILEEITAPDRYMELTEPILFYFGYRSDVKTYNEQMYPGATVVLPYAGDGGVPVLKVEDPPRKVLRFYKADADALASTASAANAYLQGAKFELWEGERPVEPTDYSKRLYEGLSGDKGLIQWTHGEETLDELVLPDGTYYLYETQAPDGYDLLEAPIQIVVKGTEVKTTPESAFERVDEENSPNITVTVMDHAAPYALPESGGPGTVWLYALGGALILTGALALLSRSRRRG